MIYILLFFKLNYILVLNELIIKKGIGENTKI
jgi:hypothetical protein